jgi:diguanylate cyclase (GGDEF)-like protein
MAQPTEVLPRPPLASFATRIILFVFLATFATALAVSWMSIRATATQIRRFADHHYPLALARCGDRLERRLRAGSAEVAALAGGTALPSALPASEHFDGFAWLDASGRTLRALGSARELGPSDGSSLPGDARLWVPPGAPDRVAASAPRGSAGGAVIGLYRREVLESILAGDPPHPAAAVVLVTAEGRVLASSAPGRMERGAVVPLPPGAKLRDTTSAAGRRMLSAARPLGAGDLHVAFEVPFAQAFEPVLSVATPLFAANLCIVLLFSFLAYRITTRMVKPIEVLSDGARRIAQGDFDLEIPEPSANDEVGLLTRTFNDMMRRLRRYQGEIESANRTLLSRNEILSQLSITDGLTHLHNHRFFQDHLTREIKRASRTQEPLSILLIDIDDFKGLNDRFGHAAGDELLVGMARIMSHCVRETDLLARYGGEEFVVLASDTDRQGAYQLAEKIRMHIDDASFILDESLRPMRVTISVGVASFEGDRKRFFDSADQALYRAKAAGKNCVVLDQVELLDAASSST